MGEMTESSILVLDTELSITQDKFLEVMWADNDFWQNVQKEQGLFDLEWVEKTEHRVATKSKVSMIRNEIMAKMIPFIPAYCDQETETLIEKEQNGTVNVVEYINSSNFPYADAITIIRRYTVKACDKGIKLKVEADLVWKQSILEQIKPFIVADVHRGMKSFGKSLESGLAIC